MSPQLGLEPHRRAECGEGILGKCPTFCTPLYLVPQSAYHLALALASLQTHLLETLPQNIPVFSGVKLFRCLWSMDPHPSPKGLGCASLECVGPEPWCQPWWKAGAAMVSAAMRVRVRADPGRGVGRASVEAQDQQPEPLGPAQPVTSLPSPVKGAFGDLIVIGHYSA